MRIITPKKPIEINKTIHKGARKRIIIIVLVIIALIFTYFIFIKSDKNVITQEKDSAVTPNQDLIVQSETAVSQVSESGLRILSGNEFRLLFDNFSSPNLKSLEIPPPITGNDIADARIRNIAQKRGYKIRKIPVNDKFEYFGGNPVQKELILPLADLIREIRLQGMSLSVVSGYRSIEEQTELFNERTKLAGIKTSDILDGKADIEIDNILIKAAVPGLSKHQTGYTVDLYCSGFEFENFKDSTCHEWLSADNYENAKKFGFIPSYPPDADVQGPGPEAWEYVWVGSELLDATID